MDRKTLLAFGLIAVVLILTPWYMSLVSPPPLENKDVGAITRRSSLNENSPSREREDPPSSLRSFSEEPVSNQEQTVDINNGLFSASLSNRGGGSFVSFIFNNYERHDSSFVNIIDDLNRDNLILGFVSLDGDDISLVNNWTQINPTSKISADLRQQTVSYETLFNGEKIKKSYTFYPNSYEVGLDLSFGNTDKYISRGQYTLGWSGGLAPSEKNLKDEYTCLLYTSPSPRDGLLSRMPSSA